MLYTPLVKPKAKKRKTGVLHIREEGISQSALKVDRENHVIRGVKILGDTSRNIHPVSGKRYRYTDNALKGFAKLQEGARVYVDHPSPDKPNTPRSYADQLGDLRNVRADLKEGQKGTYGDLHYNPSHPLASQFLADAEHNPHRLALSHLAEGAGRASGDWHLVEEARSVASVDLVCRGGTTDSLFEAMHRVVGGTLDLEKVDEDEEEDEDEDGEEKKKDGDDDDDLEEQNRRLTVRLGKLETKIALEDRRKKRELALAEAHIPLDSVAPDLMKHLVTINDRAALTVIEGLRTLGSGSGPISRDLNPTVTAFSTTDDFMSQMEG